MNPEIVNFWKIVNQTSKTEGLLKDFPEIVEKLDSELHFPFSGLSRCTGVAWLTHELAHSKTFLETMMRNPAMVQRPNCKVQLLRIKMIKKQEVLRGNRLEHG